MATQILTCNTLHLFIGKIFEYLLSLFHMNFFVMNGKGVSILLLSIQKFKGSYRSSEWVKDTVVIQAEN